MTKAGRRAVDRKSAIGVRMILLGLASMAVPQAARAEDGCTKVSAEELHVQGLTLLGSKIQDAGEGLPRHCILSGKVNERVGVDGHTYAIQFEMRLPETWNGRFLHQVNGGSDGVVVPALGDRPEGLVGGGVTP